MSTKKSLHLYFSGIVQGVGFRFTARSLARKYGLTGWVKNLFDGRVELTIEGENDKVDMFIQDLREYFASNIDNIQEEEVPLKGYTDFHILY